MPPTPPLRAAAPWSPTPIAADVQTLDDEDEGEAVDVLDDTDEPAALADALSKQRQDAVLSQAGSSSATAKSKLVGYKCPICMDDVEDATTTACGHLFCHKCIMDTLRFTEDRRPDRRLRNPRGTCPACRKKITGNDMPGAQRSLIPLTLKLQVKKRP
ncbi:SUMO-targeted ubiquitin ligase complex subunit slx8 [Ascosphaera acerosa]|nr:SUMO-targeted ubiquitin ligase complex subunit slx8 [Ascosphaera acerosa]